MSLENRLWGAPHIHGELLKLGFTVAQSTVAKYMAKQGDGRSGQSWNTFLRITAAHRRHGLVRGPDHWFSPALRPRHRSVSWARAGLDHVTAHPTAEWIAQQITEAFPWDDVPRYLIRDRDAVYGAVVTRGLRAMGIRDKPISAGSPWQNGFAEPDRHDPAGVRRPPGRVRGGTPASGPHQFAAYYNECRIHRSLNKDAPSIERSACWCHHISPCSWWPSSPILPGLTFSTPIRFSVHTPGGIRAVSLRSCRAILGRGTRSPALAAAARAPRAAMPPPTGNSRNELTASHRLPQARDHAKFGFQLRPSKRRNLRPAIWGAHRQALSD